MKRPFDHLVVYSSTAPHDVYIGRPSPWGNPFSHKPSNVPGITLVASLEEALERYEEWLIEQPELVERVRQELKGKVLGCWCAPKPCHGHILARIANEDLHLATGIICGGPPTYCGEELETKYFKHSDKHRVLNATMSEERANCRACLRAYGDALTRAGI
jgi:uncharacterized protein DUF4326